MHDTIIFHYLWMYSDIRDVLKYKSIVTKCIDRQNIDNGRKMLIKQIIYQLIFDNFYFYYYSSNVAWCHPSCFIQKQRSNAIWQRVLWKCLENIPCVWILSKRYVLWKLDHWSKNSCAVQHHLTAVAKFWIKKSFSKSTSAL